MEETKDKMLSLAAHNEKLVVVKNCCKTPLDVAMNPELSLDYAYFSITRGAQQIFTVIRKDGSTWSFVFGGGETTCIGAETVALKNRVMSFIASCGIFIKLTGEARKASLWLSGDGAMVRFTDADNNADVTHIKGTIDDAKRYTESIVNKKLRWSSYVAAATGIRIYESLI